MTLEELKAWALRQVDGRWVLAPPDVYAVFLKFLQRPRSTSEQWAEVERAARKAQGKP